MQGGGQGVIKQARGIKKLGANMQITIGGWCLRLALAMQTRPTQSDGISLALYRTISRRKMKECFASLD